MDSKKSDFKMAKTTKSNNEKQKKESNESNGIIMKNL